MKSLVLFSKAFPFGTWEPFLETEVEYYDGFDEVRVFALSVNKEQARTERPIRDPNVTVHKVRMKSRWFYLRKQWRRVLGDKELYRELRYLWRERRLSTGRVFELVEFLAKSHHEAGEIVETIRDQRLLTPGSETVFYSYRFHYQPYVMHLVAEALGMADRVRIARGHGSDLYEFTSPSDYLPLRGPSSNRSTASASSPSTVCVITRKAIRRRSSACTSPTSAPMTTASAWPRHRASRCAS
ncbi:MAG: hypothetical protein GX596_11550 [Propionibacterium sp.]|nr:hypothetical protein [Propionibacterium sp.]